MNTPQHVDVVRVAPGKWEVRNKDTDAESDALGTFTNPAMLDLFVEAIEEICKGAGNSNTKAA
jgi:hypothetical protein